MVLALQCAPRAAQVHLFGYNWTQEQQFHMHRMAIEARYAALAATAGQLTIHPAPCSQLRTCDPNPPPQVSAKKYVRTVPALRVRLSMELVLSVVVSVRSVVISVNVIAQHVCTRHARTLHSKPPLCRQEVRAKKIAALWGTTGGDSLAATAEEGGVLAQNGDGNADDDDDGVEAQ